MYVERILHRLPARALREGHDEAYRRRERDAEQPRVTAARRARREHERADAAVVPVN